MADQPKDPKREIRFSVALGKLAAGCRQELDDVTGEVYVEALCYQFPIEAFEAFVRDANARGHYEFFPRLAELRQDLLDARASSTAIAGLIPQDTRTPEQRQADAVETSRRLREIVGAEPPAWPTAKASTVEPRRVILSDERLAELRRQREQIEAEGQPS